jgi:hypothetical protein
MEIGYSMYWLIAATAAVFGLISGYPFLRARAGRTNGQLEKKGSAQITGTVASSANYSPPICQSQSFEQFLSETRVDQLQARAIGWLSLLSPPGAVVVDILHRVERSKFLQVGFSADVSKKLHEGTAILMRNGDGTTFAIAQDVTTGRIIQQGAVVAPSMLPSFASVAAVAFAVAHFLSNYDMNRKMNKLLANTDKILFRQLAELIGELEAVYETVRLAFLGKSEPSKQTMEDCLYRLRSLRSRSARELCKYLSDVSDPSKRSFIAKVTTQRDSAISKRTEDLIKEYDPLLRILSRSLNLEQQVSSALDKPLDWQNARSQVEQVAEEYRKNIQAMKSIQKDEYALHLELLWADHFGNLPFQTIDPFAQIPAASEEQVTSLVALEKVRK